MLTGDITTGSPQNRKKFIVTPQKVTVGSENGKIFWYVNQGGRLRKEVKDIETLQYAVKTAPDNKPRFIMLAGPTIEDLQTVEIPEHKQITLKVDGVSKTATLKCPKGDNSRKHFLVKNGASLTLDGKITLQGTDYGSNTQYALYVEDGGKAEIKNGVTITGFKNGNIGPVVSDGNLTMSGGEISGNKAKNGGGVYIHAAWRLFTMTGGTIKGNTADKGGGVYVNGSHNGGYPIRGQFTMLGGTITGNTAETKGNAVFVYHGDFTWESGQITANAGNGTAVDTDLSGNFNNSTNPHQEPS